MVIRTLIVIRTLMELIMWSDTYFSRDTYLETTSLMARCIILEFHSPLDFCRERIYSLPSCVQATPPLFVYRRGVTKPVCSPRHLAASL
jgi:hypothetical protein